MKSGATRPLDAERTPVHDPERLFSPPRNIIASRERAFTNAPRETSEQKPPDLSLAPPIDENVGLPVLRGVPDAEVARAAIAAHGSLVLRQFLSSDTTTRLREVAETALAARRKFVSTPKAPPNPQWHSLFPRLRNNAARSLTGLDGSSLVVDSPRGLADLLEVFEEIGVNDLARGFLGGQPAFSAEKTIFRHVTPHPPHVIEEYKDYLWHQDGAFLGGNIRALDVWIALTPAGGVYPGIEIVPRRFDRLIPPGGKQHWDLSRPLIEAALPGFTTVTPTFEPGDALLIDQLCVHRSFHHPAMTEKRLSIECWLFDVATFPAQYAGFLL